MTDVSSSIAIAPPMQRPVEFVMSRTRRRVMALMPLLGSGALLGIATALTPSSAGLGTHEQMGLPACSWVTLGDIPCPTCGMTTAFTYAADGNLLASFTTQPLGCLLAILTAMTFVLSGYVVLTGSAIGSSLRQLWGPRVGWVLIGLLLLAWVYKIAEHRGLL